MQTLRKSAIKILCVAILATTSACGYAKAKRFEKLLENDSGQKFSIAKLHTETDGYVVFKNDSTGEYVAYNLDKFKRKDMKTLTDYLAVATGANDIVHNLSAHSEYRESGYWAGGYWNTYSDSYTVCDDYGDCDTYTYYYDEYVEPYYVDTSYTYYWYEGNGMRFNTAQSSVKDLETLGALVEKAEQTAVSKMLSLQYGLSQERSENLAKLSSQFKQISSQRELSEEDKDYFAKSAIGVDFKTYDSAIKEVNDGKSKSMDALIKKASALNGTSPEQTRKILGELAGAVEE